MQEVDPRRHPDPEQLLPEIRAAVLESVRQQGKLTPELEAQITAADSKARLEDVYLPYRPKRRTNERRRKLRTFLV